MDVVSAALDALSLALSLAAPLLLGVVVVALVTGVLQSAAQAQDGSVSFVAKLLAVVVVLFLTAGSASVQLTAFTRSVMQGIAEVAR
jgi:flagellar biosynthetic protein FliQ